MGESIVGGGGLGARCCLFVVLFVVLFFVFLFFCKMPGPRLLHHGKSQVAIGFLRNTCSDPLEKQ